MDNYSTMDEMHFDILRELGNIGSGNATSALARLLNRKVDMETPSVRLVDFANIADSVGGPGELVVGILVSISGEVNGMMMFLVNTKCARKLLSILMGTVNIDVPPDEGAGFTNVEVSALEEIGNILVSSYLNSLAELTGIYLKPSIPFLSIDMANAILSVPAVEFGKVADQVLFIESVFAGMGSEYVSGYFLLIPDMPSFSTILKSLGVM
jgi:chemotaxis protein CheC